MRTVTIPEYLINSDVRMWKRRVEQEILVEGGRKEVQAVRGKKGSVRSFKDKRTKREGAEKILEKAFQEKTG